MIKRSGLTLVALLILVLLLAGCGSNVSGYEDPSKKTTAGSSWSSSAIETRYTSRTSTSAGGEVNFSSGDLSSAGDDSGALVGQKTQDMLDKAENDANLMNGFIIGQANNLFKIPGINSIQNLVFGNPYSTWGFGSNTGDNLVDGIFYQSELKQVINPLIATFSGVYATILMLAIMLSSLKAGMKAHSPQSKEDFWKDVHMYVASAFFMGLFWMLFHTLMAINWGIVQGVGSTLKSLGKPLDGVSIIATATNDDTYQFKMGDLFVFLAEWGLAAYLNFIYIARKIIIVLLCVMSPFAAYSLLFAKTRAFFGTYMKELIGNIFLPAIHSTILFVFVQMAGNLGQGMGPTIFKLGMIIMFVPVTGMVSKWLNLGDSSTAMGRTATALGLAGIGGAMMLSKGVMNMSGKGRGSANGVNPAGGGGVGTETPGGTGVSMGNDSGASVLSKAAEGGSVWNKVKKAGATAGAVVGGTVGSPFGAGGVVAGAAIGSKAFNGLLQATRNSFSGLKGTYSTIKNAGKGIGENEKPNWSFGNIGKKWGDLAERRAMMGELGESVGMFGGGVGAAIGTAMGGPIGAAIGGAIGGKLGTGGKALGQMLSGVSRQRAFEAGRGEIRPDGTMSAKGLTPEQIVGDNNNNFTRFMGGPNGMGEVRWSQTDTRSWYEAKNKDGSWERIGAYGAGDASLKGGARRLIDYNLRGPGDQWTRQENGSYTRSIQHPERIDANGRVTEKARTERELVGMSGSTATLGRKSEAYIADATGKKLHSDNSFDVRRVNPDDYFNHTQIGKVNAKGKPTAPDDRAANIVAGTYKATGAATKAGIKTVAYGPKKATGWVQQGYQNYRDRKSSGVI
ncbi:hypothetical protein EHV15_34355 [Paenibacillus oralis]|uniref:Uncharacterized protein n=1 Tax=Paenibacillus oralis TaxID=2490856 RepID=A0A3P3T9Q8_9BACL|nr:hypothetical protein [Paenibacillus oralis]RRJ54682.1 hypothetical protein EHV15_34355 [Paenibacillus oralis]